MSELLMTTTTQVHAMAEELERAGVIDVVVCPGSRSTPLALAFEMRSGLSTTVHLDERAAGFFALGMAKASRRPVALLSTSGTAAANFMPAVVEAAQGRVPLVVITADRPPELHDRGANQTIDQAHLYGRFSKWFSMLPLPGGSEGQLAHVRSVVARAAATARTAPQGPVHIDAPFREPLVPGGSLAPETPDAPGALAVEAASVAERRLSGDELERVAERLRQARRPLIVCGPLDDPDFAVAVTRLAIVVGAPVLADVLSGVRLGSHDRTPVVSRPDALARSARLAAALIPDLVIRFGGTLTSKSLGALLSEQRAPQVIVDDGGWTDALALPATIVQAAPASLVHALVERLSEGPDPSSDPEWAAAWTTADMAADRSLRTSLAALEEAFEGAAFSALEDHLPDGATVFASNSMPVRDMDAFLASSEREVRTMANRGASGIDGVVSTALGVAKASIGPVVLVVGDLAFIHDLNAVLALQGERPSLTIILVSNDGGGIFSFLSQADTDRPETGLPQHFERLFGTPHGVDFGPLVEALGISHRRLEADDVGAAVAASIAAGGVNVLEMRTERSRNVQLHRSIAAAATDAVDATLRP